MIILVKIRLKLKWLFHDIMEWVGIPVKLNRRKGEVQVLCFHGICSNNQAFINGRFILEKQCEALLKALDVEYNIISLEDFIKGNQKPNKLNILLTFDDGYLNNKTLLLPILEKYQIPASFFVTTKNSNPKWTDLFDIIKNEKISFLKLQNSFPSLNGFSLNEIKKWLLVQDDKVIMEITELLKELAQPFLVKYKVFWELLDKNDLVELKKHPLISIANHSVNHLSFTNLNEDEINLELIDSVRFLDELETPYSKVFAYPFGHYNEKLIQLLESKNIEIQFSADGSNKKRKGITDRLVVNPFISLRNQLKAIDNGQY